MVWPRDPESEYPRIWHRFQGRRPQPDGTLPWFRVQDLEPERIEEAIEFMCSDFLYNEPMCKATEVAKDPVAIEEIKIIWKKIFDDRMALVCYMEDPANPGQVFHEFVGINATSVVTKDDKHEEPVFKSEPLSQVLGAYHFCSEMVDIFKTYNIDAYLSATGLSVSKKYTGQNIGAQILKARVPLCKANGVKLTVTVFTAIGSQVLAEKVGFKEIASVSYDDLQQKHGFKLGNVDTKIMKLMTLPTD